MDSLTETWPVTPAHAALLEQIKWTHVALELPVYDTESNLVPPSAVNKALAGALVEITFTFKQVRIKRLEQAAFDSFTATIQQIVILKAAPPRAVNTFRANMRSGPKRPQPDPDSPVPIKKARTDVVLTPDTIINADLDAVNNSSLNPTPSLPFMSTDDNPAPSASIPAVGELSANEALSNHETRPAVPLTSSLFIDAISQPILFPAAKPDNANSTSPSLPLVTFDSATTVIPIPTTTAVVPSDSDGSNNGIATPVLGTPVPDARRLSVRSAPRKK